MATTTRTRTATTTTKRGTKTRKTITATTRRRDWWLIECTIINDPNLLLIHAIIKLK